MSKGSFKGITTGTTKGLLQNLLLAGSLVGAFGVWGCESGGEMQILDLDPKVGHTQGDQAVRILGKNFRQDIGYTIYFGTKKTNSVTISNPETIEVTTPSGMDEGPVDIMIRADDGNAYRIAQGFTFKDMGGSVVEGMGQPGEAKEEEKGNLAY